MKRIGWREGKTGFSLSVPLEDKENHFFQKRASSWPLNEG